jgi:hypothetical protein
LRPTILPASLCILLGALAGCTSAEPELAASGTRASQRVGEQEFRGFCSSWQLEDCDMRIPPPLIPEWMWQAAMDALSGLIDDHHTRLSFTRSQTERASLRRLVTLLGLDDAWQFLGRWPWQRVGKDYFAIEIHGAPGEGALALRGLRIDTAARVLIEAPRGRRFLPVRGVRLGSAVTGAAFELRGIDVSRPGAVDLHGRDQVIRGVPSGFLWPGGELQIPAPAALWSALVELAFDPGIDWRGVGRLHIDSRVIDRILAFVEPLLPAQRDLLRSLLAAVDYAAMPSPLDPSEPLYVHLQHQRGLACQLPGTLGLGQLIFSSVLGVTRLERRGADQVRAHVRGMSVNLVGPVLHLDIDPRQVTVVMDGMRRTIPLDGEPLILSCAPR